MKVRIEKIECPNCHADSVMVDYDTYFARCAYCESKYMVTFKGQEKILVARTEGEEQRKTIAFKNEEKRKNSEFKRTKVFRDASDKMKWARRGAIIGLIIGVLIYSLSRNIVASLAVLIASTLLFVPKLITWKKSINLAVKAICVLTIAGVALYSGAVFNIREEEKKEEERVEAEEAAAPKYQLGLSSKQVLGMDYHDVVSALQESGFTNIKTEAENDLEIKTADQQDSVVAVSVKGTTTFAETDEYAENAAIKVIYHNLSEEASKTNPGSSSEELKGEQYTVVYQKMQDANFINVVAEPIYDLTLGLLTKEGSVESVSIAGQSTFEANELFRYDDVVRIAYHVKKSDKVEDHDGEKQIPSAAKKYIGRNYEDVAEELRNAGFVDVKTVRKFEQQKKEKAGEIVLISINGQTDFEKDVWFAEDSKIVITYYGPKTEEEIAAEHPEEVKMIDSSKNLKGRNYEDVVSELVAQRFTNITSEPLYDLKNGVITKEGSIEKITVGGKEDFSEEDWFSPDVEIKIVYHAFPEESEEAVDSDSNSEDGKEEGGGVVDHIKDLLPFGK